jgi:hypothetical protein
MAEILVKAVDATNSNPTKDLRGCWKQGMPVVVMNDGHEWGAEEGLPKFIILKIPLIPKNNVLKYIERYNDVGGFAVRPRRWQIRWADLPAAARNKLTSEGELIIRATVAYTGNFDYTWNQIKSFFRNLETGLDETENI